MALNVTINIFLEIEILSITYKLMIMPNYSIMFIALWQCSSKLVKNNGLGC